MLQTFGKTWWGQQWLQSLNNIDYSNRLPRGATYARKGAVTKINIDGNQIHAKVAGSRPTPYKVDIILPPFFDPELELFIDELMKKPVIISKMLHRELDNEVLEIAEQMNLKVFPKQWTDFKMQCSCPDWAVPCKHLASVIYKLSAEIDNDPFLVFRLHRVDLIEELNKRGLFIQPQTVEIPLLKDLYFEKKKAVHSFLTENAYKKPSFSQLTPLHEALVALLSDFPAFYPGKDNFKDKYFKELNFIVKNIQNAIRGRTNLTSILKSREQKQHINTHSEETITLDDNFLTKVFVNKESFPFASFILQLIQIPSNKTADYQASTAALHTILNAALHLLANGAVVPQIVQRPDKNYAIRWLPALLSKEVKDLVDFLEGILPPDIFFWEEKEKLKTINKAPLINLLSLFLTEIIALIQNNYQEELFTSLFFKHQHYAFKQPGEEALPGGVYAWLQKYFITQGNFRPQIVVEESKDDSFLITINIRPKADTLTDQVSLNEILNNEAYHKVRFEILQGLTQLSGFIPGLDLFINTAGKKEIKMSNEVFTPFLLQMIPAVRLLDIDVLLPKSLQGLLKPKVSIKAKKKEGKSFLRLDQLLDFDWQVAIGDESMSITEFEQLMQTSDGLLKYKSQYIYVNKEDLEKLHKHFTSNETLSPLHLLRTVLSGEYNGAAITLTDEVKKMIQEFTEYKEIKLPKGLNAQLRPYQNRGYSWMYRNAQIGFGSVIADDMGLGKTLQVIATLLKFKEEGLLSEKKALVVVPTSLLSNWQAEIQKFAPTLNAHIFHGTNRKMNEDYDVLLTTYGIMRSEATQLKKLPWQTVIIDEAQNIKNADTRQAKAIKSIPADNFIAMSGTPVENRLSELWSIMDYSNRGFLGNPKEFNTTFANPIEAYNDKRVADNLKKVTAPFLMRRLKSDKSIISDLPDKIEMDSYATLAKEQASLYSKTLEEAMKEIEAIDDSDKKGLFVRQGLILQMILALKQICNHPTQYLKNKIMNPALSGKMEMLFEKLDTIIENNEKVLIFTQFKEMGKLLEQFIKERYGVMPLFYHGGSSLKKRNEMVEAFQTNPADKIFILSLKAAGTGLNLTAANHVIHYDLWWNPAVEAQATDRAYRIGQKSNVMVHRFITKNTFEEQINNMIQAKKELAEMTVTTGENWIGNLSNKELKGIFEMKG
ncbi:MAG TPA: SNF2-related protein [Edaphocola sp.]|nr:SNF2-related protein [Edaphocola sp.]